MSAMDELYASTSSYEYDPYANHAPAAPFKSTRRHKIEPPYARAKKLSVVKPRGAALWVAAACTKNVARDFRRLADALCAKQEHSSMLIEFQNSEEFMRILAMGPSVVPLLLADLRDNGSPWYLALSLITREKVGLDVEPGNLRALTAAWLSWGEANGLV